MDLSQTGTPLTLNGVAYKALLSLGNSIVLAVEASASTSPATPVVIDMNDADPGAGSVQS